MSEFNVTEPCPVCGKLDRLKLIPCGIGSQFSPDVLCSRCLCKIDSKNWNTRAPQSQWVNVSSKTPPYGTPVLLMIDSVVQHITYCLDGSGDSRDWFEPYGDHVDEHLKREFSFFVDCGIDIMWQEVGSIPTPPKG